MIDIRKIFSETRGLPSRVASELGITTGAVFQWDRVPAGRVLEVERITGVSRHSLRPDIYPLPATSPGGGEPGAGSDGHGSPAPVPVARDAA